MFNDKAIKSTDILHLDIYSLDVKNIYNRYFFLLNNFKILYRFWQCVLDYYVLWTAILRYKVSRKTNY